jgi:hypothetical protein
MSFNLDEKNAEIDRLKLEKDVFFRELATVRAVVEKQQQNIERKEALLERKEERLAYWEQESERLSKYMEEMKTQMQQLTQEKCEEERFGIMNIDRRRDGDGTVVARMKLFTQGVMGGWCLISKKRKGHDEFTSFWVDPSGTLRFRGTTIARNVAYAIAGGARNVEEADSITGKKGMKLTLEWLMSCSDE